LSAKEFFVPECALQIESQCNASFSSLASDMAEDIVFYEFSRAKMARGDFSHFLGLYAPDKLPTGRRLRGMMNSLVFGVEGYDNDPREIHSIPEIRRFYAAFHEAWPYWLYFCNLDTEVLRVMVFCCLSSIRALKVDGQPNVTVDYERLELVQFISKDFPPMNAICERAGMFERLIYDRSKAVFEYFGLPFDATPPV